MTVGKALVAFFGIAVLALSLLGVKVPPMFAQTLFAQTSTGEPRSAPPPPPPGQEPQEEVRPAPVPEKAVPPAPAVKIQPAPRQAQEENDLLGSWIIAALVVILVLCVVVVFYVRRANRPVSITETHIRKSSLWVFGAILVSSLFGFAPGVANAAPSLVGINLREAVPGQSYEVMLRGRFADLGPVSDSLVFWGLTKDNKTIQFKLDEVQGSSSAIIGGKVTFPNNLVALSWVSVRLIDKAKKPYDFENLILVGTPDQVALVKGAKRTLLPVASATAENPNFGLAASEGDPLVRSLLLGISQQCGFPLQTALEYLRSSKPGTSESVAKMISDCFTKKAVDQVFSDTRWEALGVKADAAQAQADALKVRYEELAARIEAGGSGVTEQRVLEIANGAAKAHASTVIAPVAAAVNLSQQNAAQAKAEAQRAIQLGVSASQANQTLLKAAADGKKLSPNAAKQNLAAQECAVQIAQGKACATNK